MHMELARDHDGLRGLMREFRALMDRARPEDMPEVARLRIAFSQSFRAHLAQEDAHVRDMQRWPQAAETQQIVRAHGRAMTALFLRYSDHIKAWTPAQIAADWAGYRQAVIALQNSLYERMEWEEAHLHPLLGGPVRRAA
jgi:predicted membrane chloride channel (bestrophin family)